MKIRKYIVRQFDRFDVKISKRYLSDIGVREIFVPDGNVLLR